MATVTKPYLLKLSFSVRGESSFSDKLASEFAAAWLTAHPHGTVKDSSIDLQSIPHLDFDTQEAGRTDVDKQTVEQRQSFALAEILTKDLISASAIVLATPMHNWGAPSVLKAYIDRIVNVVTFRTPPVNLLLGIPVTFIVASGGPYSVDAGPASRPHLDFLRPHLKHIFATLGAEDIVFINCDPTGPIMRGLVKEDDPSSGMSRARGQIPSASERIKSEGASREEL